uniref:Uncharacterized protein n=1 Tax=Heterorhabditis bacteriophora TaxID=37862 RepID=A0A1I7WWD5_HETBA
MREVFTDLGLPLLGWSSTVPSSCFLTIAICFSPMHDCG